MVEKIRTKVKELFKNKNLVFVIVVVLLGVLASITLFKNNYFFNMHDDLQMMRQLEMEKCFLDKQIPCRWVPDMGYGFGFPLFNYYPPLPYLVGEIFRVVGFSFNETVKLNFALGIIASGLAMYYLAKEYFGRLGGLVSSLFYIWAPYRAVDVYVRGAMNESWGWVWFPLILLSSYKLIKKPSLNRFLFLALSWSCLFLTHNLMVFIFAPVFLVWVLFWLIKEKAYRVIPKMALSGALALGLSSFFTFPAIFEQKLVHINTLVSDYYEYFAHFVSFNQLFISRFWGDGPSAFGTNDQMAFPVGQVHAIAILLVLILLTIKIIKTKKLQKLDLLIFFGAALGILGAFMAHSRSTFIWVMIPYLKFVQFPWRFLTLNVLGFAFAMGSIFYLTDSFKKVKNIWKIMLVTCVFAALIIFNWNYFKPVHSGPMTDEQKFSGEAWRLQQQAGIRDYLPISAKKDPEKQRQSLTEILKGKGVITNEANGTNWAKFETNLSEKENTIRVNIFQFPVWKAYLDGQEIPLFMADDEAWGRIYLNLPEGQHQVTLKLFDTPLRKVSNAISVVSFLVLISLLFFKKKINARFF